MLILIHFILNKLKSLYNRKQYIVRYLFNFLRLMKFKFNLVSFILNIVLFDLVLNCAKMSSVQKWQLVQKWRHAITNTRSKVTIRAKMKPVWKWHRAKKILAKLTVGIHRSSGNWFGWKLIGCESCGWKLCAGGKC